MYAERNPPEDPPCHNCKTSPFDENIDAVNIFFTVKHQFISDSIGPIDISHQAIDLAMDRDGIKNKKKCFDKVATLSRWWINRIRSKNESGELETR